MAPSRPRTPTAKHTPERRKSRRLRLLIDDIRYQLNGHQKDLDLQFMRLAQLQAEVDAVKISVRKDRG
jgi:hypothetical protein